MAAVTWGPLSATQPSGSKVPRTPHPTPPTSTETAPRGAMLVHGPRV